MRILFSEDPGFEEVSRIYELASPYEQIGIEFDFSRNTVTFLYREGDGSTFFLESYITMFPLEAEYLREHYPEMFI